MQNNFRDEYYDSIRFAQNERTSPRDKYTRMAGVLYALADEFTSGSAIVFANLTAKIDHILRSFKPEIRGYDRSAYAKLSRDVHQLRFRISHTDSYDDETLASTAPYDLRTLSLWTELLTGVTIPRDIKQLLPVGDCVITDGKAAKGYLRVIADFTEENTLHARNLSGGMEKVEISLLHGSDADKKDFTYLVPFIKQGSQLNIVAPVKSPAGQLLPELIIYEPDYLMDITSVASCFESYGTTHLNNLISRFKKEEVTKPMLLGNLVGQILDDTIHSANPSPYEKSAQEFFRNAYAKILAIGGVDRQFHEDARSQQQNIISAIDTLLNEQKSFDKKKTLLEPSFFCEMLGLQGRMDMLQKDLRVLVEQKSGKGTWGSDDRGGAKYHTKHYVQVLLYQAIIHYGYGLNNGDISSYLMYSKYPLPLIRTGNSPATLREAIEIRNRITAQDIAFANSGFDSLLTLSADDFLKNEDKREYFDKYIRPDIEDVLDSLKNADSTARKYALSMLKFVQTEHLSAKTGFNSLTSDAGFAGAWNTPYGEKIASGNILDGLTVKEFQTDAYSGAITHVVMNMPEYGSDFLPNFREGDIAAMYFYRKNEIPDIRRSAVIRTEVFRIAPSELTLKLRAPQADKLIFDNGKNSLAAIEHDLFDSSFSSLYRGIFSLLTAENSRRKLLLGQRTPQNDASQELSGDYGAFNPLVQRAKRAKDMFIVIGPPGTGKTSHALLNIVLEELKNPSAKILLAAYTNRAVDEICSKIDRAEIPFVRIGSHLGCSPAWRKNLLSEAVKGCRQLKDIETFLKSQRVFTGTIHAVTGALSMLEKYDFSLAVIDEASQILEPQMLPLLTAGGIGGNTVKKFILIGDHKQLPAIVRQPQTLSLVSDPELKGIKLFDCRNSFFQRMLALSRNEETGEYDPNTVYYLSLQGRMHCQVAAFASEMFYGSNLNPVPLEHQLREIPSIPAYSFIGEALNKHRVIFIDVKPEEQDLLKADNANRAEAKIVADTIAEIIRREGDDFDPETSVGVIVPYRSQIMAIRNAIAEKEIKNTERISIDTVERFQGSQRKYVIYSTTIKRLSQLSFLTANRFEENDSIIDRKLNVALTRTQSHIVIIGYSSLLCRDFLYSKLCESAYKISL